MPLTSCAPPGTTCPGSLRIVRPVPRTAAAALAAAVLLVPTQPATAAPAADSPMVDVAACTARDPYEDVVLPFPFTFYGETYEEVGLGDRSAIFSGSLPFYAQVFPLADLGAAMIAPLYGEGDDDLTGWGTTTYEGHRAFCATWKDIAPDDDWGG